VNNNGPYRIYKSFWISAFIRAKYAYVGKKGYANSRVWAPPLLDRLRWGTLQKSLLCGWELCLYAASGPAQIKSSLFLFPPTLTDHLIANSRLHWELISESRNLVFHMRLVILKIHFPNAISMFFHFHITQPP
jgi:hypothetical protein